MAEILHQFIGSLSHYLQGFIVVTRGISRKITKTPFPSPMETPPDPPFMPPLGPPNRWLILTPQTRHPKDSGYNAVFGGKPGKHRKVPFF